MMEILAAVGLVLGGITCVARMFENRLFVENRSGQEIASIQITTADSTTTFGSVPDGEVVSTSFRIWRETDFAVSGRLADGTKLGGNFGYAMDGMRARFVIERDGKIDFSQ